MTGKQPHSPTATPAPRVQPSSLLQRPPAPARRSPSSSPLPLGEGLGVRAALPTATFSPRATINPVTLIGSIGSPMTAPVLQRQTADGTGSKSEAPANDASAIDSQQAPPNAAQPIVSQDATTNNSSMSFTPVVPMRQYAFPVSPSLLGRLNLGQIAAVAVTQDLASRSAGYDPTLVGKEVLQSILNEIGQQVAGQSRLSSAATSFATGFVGQSLLGKEGAVGGFKSGGLGAAFSLVIPGPASEKFQVKFSLTPDFNDPKQSSVGVGISINLDALTGSSGNRPRFQPKLTVNTPGDKYEQEADRVADMVMRMPEPTVQRECATCGGKSPTGGECPECKKKKPGLGGTLQRLSTHGDSAAGMAAPPIVSRVLSSPGSPLPADTRSFMESRFGADFMNVRVHTDSLAAESAAAVQAKAYTVGSHIAFGPGASLSDKHLLAHELAHTVQQMSGVRRSLTLVQRSDTSAVLPNQNIQQQATKPEIKFRIDWLIEGGIPVETNGQVAVMARLVIASLQDDLAGVESATVAAQVAEWISTVKGFIPYFDRHMGEEINPDLVPLINHQYDNLLKVRAAVQQDKLTQIKDALWREHDAALKAAEEAEALQPAFDDALRAAYRKGSSNTVKEVVSAVKGALSVGRNLQKLAADITKEIMGLPVPSGTKIHVDHWTSQVGKSNVIIVNISKYTDMLAKLGRGFSALSVVLTIADRSKRATEAEQGMKDLSDVINISSDLISASPLSAPPHFALYSTLYLKPALKIIAKQFGMLVENLSDYNRTSVEVTGDLMYPAAEPGGQEMFDLMIKVMHAEDESGFPALPSGVKEYLFDHREKLSAGVEADVPTEGSLFWKHFDSSAGRSWLFDNRKRVWALFYGSLNPPKRRP